MGSAYSQHRMSTIRHDSLQRQRREISSECDSSVTPPSLSYLGCSVSSSSPGSSCNASVLSLGSSLLVSDDSVACAESVCSDLSSSSSCQIGQGVHQFVIAYLYALDELPWVAYSLATPQAGITVVIKADKDPDVARHEILQCGIPSDVFVVEVMSDP